MFVTFHVSRNTIFYIVMPKVTFESKSTLFYSEVKQRVRQYFLEKNLKETGNWKLYIKAIILVGLAVGIYVSLVSGAVTGFLAVILAGFFGFILACIGFNIMHDACHGSYSSKKWINNVLGLTLNALGGNAFIWKFKHNIIHHTYTNIDGIDDDIAKSPIIRQCPTQKWVPAHRFQHLYIFFVYAISSFAWIFVMDFTKYFRHKVYKTPLQAMNKREHFIFWVSKVMYVLFYILVPVYFVGWQAWAIGFAAFHVVMGLTLALVFQLAHVVESTTFEKVYHDNQKIENDWAIHQVVTTANFACRDSIITWLVGGLNYQVEHHLFPRVSHIHYPEISRIVKHTCSKFNISYNEYYTMADAITSHVRMMRTLGQHP